MKCVKLIEGPIKRVGDLHAAKLVTEGEAIYVPKEVWKKQVRGPVDSAKCEGRE